MTETFLIVLAYILGFVTALVLRIGRERTAYRMGIAIGRRKRLAVVPEEWTVR